MHSYCHSQDPGTPCHVREQGDKEELYKVIIGVAATTLKSKCPWYAEIEKADLWAALFEFHGRKHGAALLSLVKFVSDEMYGMHMLASMDYDTATTALQGYAITISLLIKHIPVILLHQITRQDMVDRCMERIPLRACGNV